MALGNPRKGFGGLRWARAGMSMVVRGVGMYVGVVCIGEGRNVLIRRRAI